MRNRLLASVLALLISCLYANAAVSSARPNLEGLQLVAHLPAEVPQRITGFTYDGEKIWVAIYHGRGLYATLDPSTLLWKVSAEEKERNAISEVAGAFASPGGVCFINGKLWVGGSYGDSFGSIDTRDWKIESVFKGKQRQSPGSQSYAGMAYDGNFLWIAWHWTRYNLPPSQTQLLLKIEPESGKVVAEYPLPPGTRNDITHGLTWDGSSLWHMKDNKLSSIDASSGIVTGEYRLGQIERATGLAWDGHALWIAEFDGNVWRLPF